jgi:hypothetical protein
VEDAMVEKTSALMLALALLIVPLYAGEGEEEPEVKARKELTNERNRCGLLEIKIQENEADWRRAFAKQHAEWIERARTATDPAEQGKLELRVQELWSSYKTLRIKEKLQALEEHNARAAEHEQLDLSFVYAFWARMCEPQSIKVDECCPIKESETKTESSSGGKGESKPKERPKDPHTGAKPLVIQK